MTAVLSEGIDGPSGLPMPPGGQTASAVRAKVPGHRAARPAKMFCPSHSDGPRALRVRSKKQKISGRPEIANRLRARPHGAG